MNCKNCCIRLKDSQKFCDECGAKVIHNRLTPKVLATQVNEEFISIDNKFLKTFIYLFIKPADVIHGYISGTRKKYINVVQYLAISITILGLQYFIINSINPEFFTPEQSALDDELAKFYPPESLEMLEKFSKSMNEYMSLVYLIGLPISALLTWVVFLKERMHNFTEHLVINMYITAQYIIFSALIHLIFFTLGINITTLITLLTVFYILYFGFTFYKLYSLKISTIFVRFLYSLVLFMAFTLIFSILTGVVMIIYLKFIK